MSARWRWGLGMAVLAVLVCGSAGLRSPLPPAFAQAPSTWVRPTDGMTMVYVPAGEFVMGLDSQELQYVLELCAQYNPGCHLCDPGRDACRLDWFQDALPAHPVRVGAFWIDRTEVTNAQYRRCVRAGVCTPPQKESLYTNDVYHTDPAYDAYPVVHVSWEQAATYCSWVGGRLPTEAEWEYAARGPQGNLFPWGETFDGRRLNYCDANCWFAWRDHQFDDGYADTAPVGSYPSGASWCGALDLAGNVWEWVSDGYSADGYAHAPSVSPPGAEASFPESAERVLRGGSWGVEPVYVNSAYRWHALPDRTKIYWGFRCVIEAPSP